MQEGGKKHPSEYLNDLEEWQEHQYNPGYWTGGNIPPYLKYPKKPLGIIFIIAGVLNVVLPLVTELSLQSVVDNIYIIVIGLILLAAGIRIIWFRN